MSYRPETLARAAKLLNDALVPPRGARMPSVPYSAVNVAEAPASPWKDALLTLIENASAAADDARACLAPTFGGPIPATAVNALSALVLPKTPTMEEKLEALLVDWHRSALSVVEGSTHNAQNFVDALARRGIKLEAVQ